MSEITTNRTPDIIAVEIKSLETQGTAMFLSVVAEIGKRLIEVKAILPRGEWGKRLDSSVNYSDRTAQQYMRIAQEYSSVNTKPDSFLNFTQALALLSLPKNEREQFMQENDVESMSKRELQKAIKEAKAADKRAKEAEAKSVALSQEKIEIEQQRDEIEIEYRHMKENLHQMMDEKMNIVNQKIMIEDEFESVKSAFKQAQLDHKRLMEQIKEMEAQPSDPSQAEQIRILQHELYASNERITELTDQLKQPITVESSVVEKIPEATIQELEALRAENERLRSEPSSPDKTLLKYRICFESLKTNFNQLLQTITEIEDTDTQIKYKNAATKLLVAMGERL